jgi:hypothetical protein
MAKELDFDDKIEKALNEADSDEDIAAEYVQSELVKQECEERYCYGVELEEVENDLLQKIFDDIIDNPCCSQNCGKDWKIEDLQRHTQDIQKLSKIEKKLVLLTILRNCATHSHNTRHSEQRQRLSFTFKYEPLGSMCAFAFRVLFDIGIESFRGLLAHLKISDFSIIPPLHGNYGKRGHQSHQLTNRGVTENLIGFVLALAEAQGELSPGRDTKRGKRKEDKNPDILWLPACFTQSAILRMYNQAYPDFSISRASFRLLLQSDSRLGHIQIRSSRTDMCDFCELQKRRIIGTKVHDELKAEKLVAELAAHQKAYQGERAIYNAEREQAKNDRKKWEKGKLSANKCLEHISMDYGQSIEVPHTADQLGGTFYLHMRKFLLFCVCSVLEKSQICYTYDEREAGKGPNEVISFLHDFLVNRQIQSQNIRIHADNCTGQNKNRYVLWYLIWLVATGRLKHVELKFMIKGHTHCVVDGGIGQTKKKLRRADVFCLDHWKEVIDQSSNTNQARIVNSDNVFDWKKGLRTYFKAFKGISKFQHFLVDASEPGWISAKYGFDDDVWQKKNLIKSDGILEAEAFKNLPQYLKSVGFKGGTPEKEKALFENLRQYVKDPWKDELCPNPETFKVPIREKQSCPNWT